jgi:DNA-binding CsgD family transcriptional regulator
VARIELRPSRSDAEAWEALHSSLYASALHGIKQTVRPGDRLCPYGQFRLAVAFGPDADAVASKVLGERLARAVSLGLPNWQAVDGRAHPQAPALSDAGSKVPLRVSGGDEQSVAMSDTTTVVTVDRLLGSGLAYSGAERNPTDRPCGALGASTANVSLSHLRHRTVLGNSRRTDAAHGTRRDDQVRVETPPSGLILVMECDPESTGTQGIATLATCSEAERLGFDVRAIPLPTGDTPPVAVDGMPIDLVVLLVGSEPTGRPRPWASSTWCLPAQLAEAYGIAGIAVIAVSVGAGVGALANCITKGATVLFDFNELPDHLARWSQRASADQPGSWESLVHRVPPQLDALMRLTSSERRVLFYLTTGTSARDISLELVVSLATVRSHIRSILRKLAVRSQLAAVALANGRGLHRDGGGLDTTDPVTWALAGPEDARSA